MKHCVMKALILEDDTLLADLLETVVGGLYPGIDIFVTASVRGLWHIGPNTVLT